MPIYEYVCRHCGEQLEQLQKMSEAALTDCPACGQAALKRKVSAAGFRLAGGGWYETDFKADGKRNIAGRDDKSGASDASGDGSGKNDKKDDKSSGDSGSKSDAKPAAKTESKPDKPDKPAGNSGDTPKKTGAAG